MLVVTGARHDLDDLTLTRRLADVGAHNDQSVTSVCVHREPPFSEVYPYSYRVRRRDGTGSGQSVRLALEGVEMSSEPEPVPLNGQGVVTRSTAGTVADALERLLRLLRDRGIKVFAVIDHSGEAEQVGQRLPDTKLVVFGNPSAGTALMQAAPLVALDLPLKILIWERDHQSFVSYNEPSYLAERYRMPAEQATVLSTVAALAHAIHQPEKG